MPHSANTIRSWILQLYRTEKALLIATLSDAAGTTSDIHFSFDLWTSPNCKAMLGLTTRFSCRLQLSHRRLRLGDDILDAREFLKSLVHNGLLGFAVAQKAREMLEALQCIEEAEELR